MSLDTSIVGKPSARQKVVVERGAVANFAKSVKDDNPIYRDPAAAGAAGFDGIPVPPTFPFVWGTWGAFPEIQPDTSDIVPGGAMSVIGKLRAEKGGLILHGEQEFEYHRPVLVGEVLTGEGAVSELYQKESGGKTMTFCVTETVWRDEAGEPVITARFNLIHRG